MGRTLANTSSSFTESCARSICLGTSLQFVGTMSDTLCIPLMVLLASEKKRIPRFEEPFRGRTGFTSPSGSDTPSHAYRAEMLRVSDLPFDKQLA